LARTDDAPAGTKGLSLFLVPKFLADEDGNFTIRNDVFAIGLEHKMGIHGSPTCVMEYGANTGAKGWLVGKEMSGMAMMFIMMNSARLNVGAQGVGIAERAWQQAYSYAIDRKQGRAIGLDQYPAAIIHHPDVRRMLVEAKAKIAAARAITYACGFAADQAAHNTDSKIRERAKRREDLLTPLAKSYGSDIGCEVSSTALQVHGGMGYIEETGAAQHFRDARIAPIYEGTNAIQAIDLVGRKLSMAGGLLFTEMFADIKTCITDCAAADYRRIQTIGQQLSLAVSAMQQAVNWLSDPQCSQADRLSGATAFQTMSAQTIGGFYLAKGALVAAKLLDDPGGDEKYLNGRIDLALVFAKSVLGAVPAGLPQVTITADTVFALDEQGLAP